MMDEEWSYGALRTQADLENLLKKAKIDEIHLWEVVYPDPTEYKNHMYHLTLNSDSLIEPLSDDRFRFVFRGENCLSSMSLNHGEARIPYHSRGQDMWGYLFPNYWLAYGYYIRQMKLRKTD